MLNWIKGYVDRWTGVVDSGVRDLVRWGLHALAGVVYTVFGHVGRAWSDLLAALKLLHKYGAELAGWIVAHLRQLVLVDIPRLAAQALSYFRAALTYALSLYRLALAGLERLRADAAQWVRDALTFVDVHVYRPLLALAQQLRADLLKWGYWAYQLLNDPARLSAILLDALIAAAEAAFWRISAPAAEFALRLVLANAQRFAQLAETVITAVL